MSTHSLKEHNEDSASRGVALRIEFPQRPEWTNVDRVKSDSRALRRAKVASFAQGGVESVISAASPDVALAQGSVRPRPTRALRDGCIDGGPVQETTIQRASMLLGTRKKVLALGVTGVTEDSEPKTWSRRLGAEDSEPKTRSRRLRAEGRR